MPALKGSKNALGNEGGRPTGYKEEYNLQAYKLCLLGATDKDLADFFSVDERTINNWKEKHDKFFQSIREGKEIADMEVANSLYDTTKDRTVYDEQAIKIKEVFYNEAGKRVETERVELVEVKRTIPADFRSQQFWLKNRKSNQWRDAQQLDHTTNGKDISVDISKLSSETLKALEDAYKDETE